MLRSKTTTGVLWNFTEQLSRRGIGIIITLLLARFLVPEDFGLIAMMAVFTALAGKLMESGFKQALIRMQCATQEDYSTAFYANLIMGGLAYLLLYISAPSVSEFYNESRLTDLIRVAGVAILINSFQLVQSAILSRQLNFKAQMKATIPATIISGLTAVLLAYLGFGVWALILQILVSSFFITIFYWSMNLWRPTFVFSILSLRQMFGFGFYLFIDGMISIIFKNMFVVVIAKLFTSTTAGYYFFAEKFIDLIINQLVTSIQNVTYPALSSIQDENVRLKEGYRKVIQITTFLLFPSMAIMAALSEPMFRVLLHNRWLPAVPYLQLMCIACMLYPLHTVNLNILKVKGRSDFVLYLGFLKKIVFIAIFFFSYRYGVIGILIGQIFSSILAYLPNSYYSDKLIGYSVCEQIYDFLPGLILSCVVSGAVYWAVLVSDLSALSQLVFFLPLAVLTYLIVGYFCKLKAFKLTEAIVRDRIAFSKN